ncbi:MAG: protease complex subunit PrcB family protein [Desulfuromonadales bacterium]|nr:MAG: protease complex subunit PrcB family protein [Desulfuromonadales bacterium]
MIRKILSAMVFVWIGGIAGGAVAGAAALPVPFTTIEKGARSPSGESEGDEGPRLAFFRAEHEFAPFWGKLHSGRTPVPPLPVVDFERFDLLVVTDQVRPTGGHDIEIRDVAEADRVVWVTAHITRPGFGCITTQVITQPYHIVQVVKSGERYQLKLVETVRNCIKK